MFRYVLCCIILLVILSFTSYACAEIVCECEENECICFIQLGDEGIAIKGIAELLIKQGYLSSTSNKSLFDNQMLTAVCAFQLDCGLRDTGLLDDDTLTYLIWGMSSSELTQNDECLNVRGVWVPTDGGKKRHLVKTCSGMFDPRMMSVRNAEELGIDVCRRCNNGFDEK